MVRKKVKRRLANEFRIIGGEWRGRKFTFPSLDQIRPTPNRVRETLFNWVQHDIARWRCLDLYAGSGALGMEALSRGAEYVTFVDMQPQVVKQIGVNLAQVATNHAKIVCADAISFIESYQVAPVDLVFLDPPFHQGLLKQCCELLEAKQVLAQRAYIYLETEQPIDMQAYPTSWEIKRCQKAGQVYAYLIDRSMA